MTRSSHALARPGATLRYWTSRPVARSCAPTLVLLYGATLDHHPWDVARSARAWARRDALAEYAEIPAAGHMSNLDDPEVFTQAVEDFLSRLGAGQGVQETTAIPMIHS